VKGNLLMPWLLGDSVLDNDEFNSLIVEVLSPAPNTNYKELNVVRIEGDKTVASLNQTSSLGLEMVPYVEVEPTPLDLSQSLVVGGYGGSRGAGKEVDLIMTFSQIVGVSCDSYIKKLKVAFAHILADKVKKMAKKIVGGKSGG
jgi:hypothetical protein